jgi:hypothetical protein
MNKERLYAFLESKLSNSVGHRVDLQFQDARRINKTTAHFMLAFTGETPSSDEMSEFFIRHYNAKITPYISTARVYESEKVVTVVASILNVSRDFSDIKKCGMATIIQGSSYLDVPLQEIWEVQTRNGQKVIVRKVKDDVMAIVQARRNAMVGTPKKTFAGLAQGSSLLKYLAILEKGDHVKAYIDEKVVDAEVLMVSDNEVKLKHAGGVASLPRQSVIEIVSRAKEKDASEQKMVQDYFTQAYGDPEYARQLVKK